MVDFIDRSSDPPNEQIKLYNKLIAAPEYLKGDSKTLLRFDYRPIITKPDVDKGSINRYFAKQSNLSDGEIIEISETHYNDLVNVPLYDTATITWRIKGRVEDVKNPNSGGPTLLYMGVLTSNTLAIKDGDRQIPGLRLKLIDPLEFFQEI